MRTYVACLLVITAFIAFAPAAYASISDSDQAWINLLRGHDAAEADRIERELKKIEESSTPFEARRRKEEFLWDEHRKYQQKMLDARGTDDEQSAWNAYQIIVFMWLDVEQERRTIGPKFSNEDMMRMGEDPDYNLDRSWLKLHDFEMKRMAGERAQNAKKGASSDKQISARETSGSTYAAVAVAPAFVFGHWEWDGSVHLGTENALTEQFFNVEGKETGGDFAGVDLHATVGLSRASALHFGVNAADVAFSGVAGDFDPLGQRLLFPGVTSNGFFLTGGVPEGTSGGQNVVERMRYGFNADNVTMYGAYSMACDHGPYTIIGYGGLAQTRSNQSERLTGRVPGYDIAFEYDTRFNTDVTRITAGARVMRGFDSYPGLTVNAGATLFGNFADTDGRDSLQLGGVFESHRIGKNEFTFGWRAGAGAELNLGGPLTLFASYSYFEDDVTPVAVRHDDGPSHAEFEKSWAHVGMIGGRLTY